MSTMQLTLKAMSLALYFPSSLIIDTSSNSRAPLRTISALDSFILLSRHYKSKRMQFYLLNDIRGELELTESDKVSADYSEYDIVSLIVVKL